MSPVFLSWSPSFTYYLTGLLTVETTPKIGFAFLKMVLWAAHLSRDKAFLAPRFRFLFTKVRQALGPTTVCVCWCSARRPFPDYRNSLLHIRTRRNENSVSSSRDWLRWRHHRWRRQREKGPLKVDYEVKLEKKEMQRLRVKLYFLSCSFYK